MVIHSLFLHFTSIFFLATLTLGKAIISQYSTDNNHALGMTIATTSFGAGLVIGPALSGFLADPLNQYNITITSKSPDQLSQRCRLATGMGLHLIHLGCTWGYSDPFWCYNV